MQLMLIIITMMKMSRSSNTLLYREVCVEKKKRERERDETCI